MTTINWQVFYENTSTKEALNDFATGKIGLDRFEKDCWPQECKKEIRRLKQLGVKVARERAKRALKRDD